MFLEEDGVIFPFPQQKERDGGKSIIINFFKSLGKNPSRVSLFINLKIFRECVG